MRITLIAAQSLDGFITRHDQPGSDFASAEDREFFRDALRGFDCCVMGATSYREASLTIKKHLKTERLRIVLTRNPDVFANDAVPGRLEFTNATPAQLVAGLALRGCRTCALLGGAQINSLFVEAGLVDEVWLTVEPLLFGSGTPLLARRTGIELALFSSQSLSPDTLLLKYRVKK